MFRPSVKIVTLHVHKVRFLLNAVATGIWPTAVGSREYEILHSNRLKVFQLSSFRVESAVHSYKLGRDVKSPNS